MRVADLSRSAAVHGVIERVAQGASARVVLLAALAAARPVLRRTHEDPAVVAAFAIALERPRRAVRSGSRMALVAAVAEALDAHADALGRTDLGELAQLAVLDTFLAGLAGVAGGERAEVPFRAVVGRFLARFVLALLARELPEHVGDNRRFASVEAHARFVDELAIEARTLAETLPFALDPPSEERPGELLRRALGALPAAEVA